MRDSKGPDLGNWGIFHFGENKTKQSKTTPKPFAETIPCNLDSCGASAQKDPEPKTKDSF